MTFQGLLIHQVVIYPWEEGADDTYGGVEDAFGTAVAVSARVVQTGQEEDEIDRDTRYRTAKVFLPPGTAITGTSEVAHGSTRYRVQGEPKIVYDSDGEHHIEAELREVLAG